MIYICICNLKFFFIFVFYVDVEFGKLYYIVNNFNVIVYEWK